MVLYLVPRSVNATNTSLRAEIPRVDAPQLDQQGCVSLESVRASTLHGVVGPCLRAILGSAAAPLPDFGGARQ